MPEALGTLEPDPMREAFDTFKSPSPRQR